MEKASKPAANKPAAKKPAAKKPAAKKPAAKKSPTEPKRKAEQHYQLAQIVTRLEIVADKLAQAAEHLASHPGAPQEESPQHSQSTDPANSTSEH
jgi:hypothetical protein